MGCTLICVAILLLIGGIGLVGFGNSVIGSACMLAGGALFLLTWLSGLFLRPREIPPEEFQDDTHLA